jgi:Family of unknown function (DUF6174)
VNPSFPRVFHHRSIWAGAFALVAAGLGCSPQVADSPDDVPDSLLQVLSQPLTDSQRDSLRREMDAAEGRWAALGSTAYRVEIRRSMDPSRWMVMSVSEDTVRSLVVIEEEGLTSPRISPSDPQGWPTIPGLFSLVALAIAKASSVSVEFHPELGYPTRLFIDYSPEVFDDEVWYSVRELELLSG